MDGQRLIQALTVDCVLAQASGIDFDAACREFTLAGLEPVRLGFDAGPCCMGLDEVCRCEKEFILLTQLWLELLNES